MKKILLFLFMVSAMVSCRTVTKVVEVPVTKELTTTVFKVDTVKLKDSVYVKEYTKGDTVFKEKIKYLTKYQIKYRDSLRVDSIEVPKIVEKEVVTNKLNWFQTTMIYIGFIALIWLFIYLTKKHIKL